MRFSVIESFQQVESVEDIDEIKLDDFEGTKRKLDFSNEQFESEKPQQVKKGSYCSQLKWQKNLRVLDSLANENTPVKSD